MCAEQVRTGYPHNARGKGGGFRGEMGDDRGSPVFWLRGETHRGKGRRAVSRRSVGGRKVRNTKEKNKEKKNILPWSLLGLLQMQMVNI